MLWFAFKKLYLWSDKQLRKWQSEWWCRCDLLSKNCIFDLINNQTKINTIQLLLWFAFKKLYLWSDKQRLHKIYDYEISCDLLSKNCIFDLINNTLSLLWVLKVLWFAFKKLYLWSDKQPSSAAPGNGVSCDLLSKNCIFDLINNLSGVVGALNVVVICFQKIVSLIW